MLKSLSVKNYALIQDLNIDFESGFSTMTGETGAGKSILLGALQLVLGGRADASVLLNAESKCVVEAGFSIKTYGLENVLADLGADYEPETIIRREILPNGKSRAFVNDTPVNVTDLKALSSKLLDIHSQHHNLELNNNEYQLMVIDAVGVEVSLLKNYQSAFQLFRRLNQQLAELTAKSQLAAKEHDYNIFQLSQLDEANLDSIDLTALEAEYETLTHASEIKVQLAGALNLLSESEFNVLDGLKQTMQWIDKVKKVYPQSQQWLNRIEPVYIELKDVATEIETDGANVEDDPKRAEHLKEILDKLYNLMQKHQAETVEGLIEQRERYQALVSETESYELAIEKLVKEVGKTKDELTQLGKHLTNQRQKCVKPFETNIKKWLTQLGMPDAQFVVSVETSVDFTPNGCDKVNFLFSANKNIAPQNINKVASGGEISRLMLSIKRVLSESVALPTIIFDEIDTGVSGQMAEMMAIIMSQMADKMQVISITHLPQIASKGQTHYKVYKHNAKNTVTTEIIKLSATERIEEIARLLSGQNITPEATENAKVLLGMR